MLWIGIDPGKSGAMATINEYGEIDAAPFDLQTYIWILQQSLQGDGMKAVVEKVGAMPGQGVVSMFKFGENFGMIQGVLQAFGVPYELVTPQKWKKEFGVTADKNTSIEVCRRLFPLANLKRSERCRKDDDGIAEAILMAEFARRHMR